MDKLEALEFIGLHEPLTEDIVNTKYTERFNYYHMLYTNAPNKVIEKIQQQNLEKLNQAKRFLLEDVATKKAEFNKHFLESVITPIKINTETKEKPVLAWLIVHTENRNAVPLPVREGVNFIGRKKKDDGANWIVIGNDPFVSRTHAFIKAKQSNGLWHFVLYDGDGSKASVNGIFLNGKETRVNQYCSLTENDTVQIGTTKLVFRTKKESRSVSGELEDVMHTDFIRTIDIK